MKVKVPNKVKLLTHTYDVRFDTKHVVAQGTCGITRHLYQDILLDNLTLPPSELIQVLIHEYVHVIERHFCVKLEESEVEAISEGITVLLVDSFGLEFDWSDIENTKEG